MAKPSTAKSTQCPHSGDTTACPAAAAVPTALSVREMEAEALALLESEIVAAPPARVSSVLAAIRTRGTYLQTYDELLAGARPYVSQRCPHLPPALRRSGSGSGTQSLPPGLIDIPDQARDGLCSLRSIRSRLRS